MSHRNDFMPENYADWGDRAPDFARYMKAVDSAVTRTCGLGVYDLPDYDFASAFEDDVPPAECAEMVLEEAGFPG